jgi:senataxin
MLVGDPNQLPPTVMSEAGRKYGLNKSLYDRLYTSLIKSQSGPITMLNVQYRMHRDICKLPNFCFYDDTLITPPSVDKRSKNFPLQRLYFYNLANTTEIGDRGGSKRNEKEALVVHKLCHMLVDHLQQYRLENNCSLNLQSQISKSIAIMTPYRDQVRFLQSCDLPAGIEIMTIDGAQGKEKDIIIYSCVRNNDEDIGFLNDKRRLNVALTRAREALYVIGNIKQFARNAENECWIKMVDYLQSNDRNIIEDLDNNILTLPVITKA